MPRYVYEAYDQHGALTKGEIEAQSRERALEALHRQGRITLDLKEENRAAWMPWWQRDVFGGSTLPLVDLELFTREIAMLVKADLPLDETLRIVVLQPLISSKMRAITTGLLNRVREGASLSRALAESGRFPNYYCRIIQAGEAGGSLGAVFDDLAKFLERSLEMRRQITSALIYPVTLMIAALVTLVVIISVLLPTIVPLFSDAGAPLPATVQMMVNVQTFAANNWILLVGLLAVLVVGLVAASRDARLGLVRDRLLLKLPVFGRIISDRETARFSRTLSTLLHNGVPMLEAVSISSGVMGNRSFAAAAEDAVESLKEGRPLSAPLSASGLFSELSVRLVGVGEQTGQLDTMLMQVATVYEATVQRQLARLMTLVTPVLTLLIGTVVGGLILSVMNAILSVNDLAFK